jgi:hypothetical protein
VNEARRPKSKSNHVAYESSANFAALIEPPFRIRPLFSSEKSSRAARNPKSSRSNRIRPSTSAIRGTARSANHMPLRPLHKPTASVLPISAPQPRPAATEPSTCEDEFRRRKGQAEGRQGGVAVVQGRAAVPRRPHRAVPQGRQVRAARRRRRARLPLRRPRVPRRRGEPVLSLPPPSRCSSQSPSVGSVLLGS